MNFSVPVYIQRLPIPESTGFRHRVRPLFFPGPVETHESLGRAVNRLAVELRRELHQMGRAYRHDRLADYSFCPDLDGHRLDLVLELRQERVKCCFLFVAFEALGRKVAFTPSVPDVWFEVARGERLVDRATEVLTQFFRNQEKAEEENFQSPAKLTLPGNAWVTTLEMDIDPAQVVEEPDKRPLACFGATAPADGGVELQRVGRCLDRLYPDDLDRALHRDAEVAELTRLLRASDQRPVLLLGPRQVGKTALIHEYVFHTVAKRDNRHQLRENDWLVSPQRLISGMSYVGQWEERLLAILKEVKKRDHVLYLDDLLGLYHAGVSRDADLSVAQVLKPFVERREIRLLAEATPETFRVLREKDRGFADLFHLLPLREPGEDENRRILIAVMRQLEGKHRCRFNLEVLPAALDLLRRYLRGVAFPGKAAAFLGRLAVKCRGQEVSRDQVLEEFHAQSGLAVTFLDGRSKLDRQLVEDELARGVIGQPAALRAAADVLSIAKARLNDPDRPLASFLLLGPTGVGKTQTAKALAAYLFGDAARLLRFDMNEFVSPDSAARLAGTFYNPEGLLTSAVRRQPFAVILLDEIEKAHPDVFDLLLQVLGEGRLTDALGRTVDFTNTIVLMTSNLGVRQVESRLGFGDDAGDRSAYVHAAEKFFRPEFFNRLDRVVPFERLGRDDVQKIARLLIRDLFQREGLLRRKCLMRVEAGALDRVIDLGYDPVLGARALKPALERHLTQPVAACLASGVPDALTVVSLYPSRDLVEVGVQALDEVNRAPSATEAVCRKEPVVVLDRVEATVEGIEARFVPFRPAGVLSPRALRAEHYQYFAIQEQVHRVRERCRQLREGWEATQRADVGGPSFPLGVHTFKGKSRRIRKWMVNDKPVLREIALTEDMHAFFQELAAAALPCGEKVEDLLVELLHQVALLQAMADGCTPGTAGQALLVIRDISDSSRPTAATHGELYLKTLGAGMGLEARRLCSRGPNPRAEELMLLKGTHALAVARVEEGTHLFCPGHESLLPVQVSVLPLGDEEDPLAAAAALHERRRAWLQAMMNGQETEDPWRLLPVVRVYDDKGSTLDLRSGLLTPTPPAPEALRTFILSALPLPSELLA
jgi:ATP-dependent Clp protease ATP-binding subunit ClpA